ncbi:MAG: nucleotidyl transferase AbiEii/AbiGii toxin family protein [Firmicutes bacterium]|nr:nucleotidyl transferase AbiEii/AbiGii toxin family protein [Bacillota bacterium]
MPKTVSGWWGQWLRVDPSQWPLRRLFWSGEEPALTGHDDLPRVQAIVATILQEGTPADWEAIRWSAVLPLLPTLPVADPVRAFWEEFWKEAQAMEDRRAQVLDTEQRHILRVAAAVLPAEGFELAGGTALAAGYLGHRLSDDLDFFTDRPAITAGLRALQAAWTDAGIPWRVETAQTTFARLWVGTRPVKVELAQDSAFHLEPTRRSLEGMPIRSLADLAADKCLALFGRAATRDFVDVYYLLQTTYDLSQLMTLARQKDPGFDRDWFIKALLQVDRVHPAQVRMLAPIDWDDVRRVFRHAAIRLERQRMAEEAESEEDERP